MLEGEVTQVLCPAKHVAWLLINQEFLERGKEEEEREGGGGRERERGNEGEGGVKRQGRRGRCEVMAPPQCPPAARCHSSPRPGAAQGLASRPCRTEQHIHCTSCSAHHAGQAQPTTRCLPCRAGSAHHTLPAMPGRLSLGGSSARHTHTIARPNPTTNYRLRLLQTFRVLP